MWCGRKIGTWWIKKSTTCEVDLNYCTTKNNWYYCDRRDQPARWIHQMNRVIIYFPGLIKRKILKCYVKM